MVRRGPTYNQVSDSAYFAETRSTQYILEDGILLSKFRPGIIFTIKDVLQNAETRKTFQASFPCPLLIDLRMCTNASMLSVLSSSTVRDADQFNAVAILYSNEKQERIAREGARFHQTGFPLRIFDNEEAALTWLAKYKMDR